MSKAKIFIDGAAGTTGLEIRERLAPRAELDVLVLYDAERKDVAARKRMLNAADLVILCLPDEAAKEAVSLIDNPNVRVIDASTAHRIAPGWIYGFAELEADGGAQIAAAKRVAVMEGRPLLAVTFEPHPRRFFKPQEPSFRITPEHVKERELKKLGVDEVHVLDFNAIMANLSAAQFIDIGGDDAQVLGDHRQVGEIGLQRAEQGVAGRRVPLPLAGGPGSGGHGPVRHQAAEVIDAHQGEALQLVADKIKAELGGKVELDRHRIQLEKPIKETGAHEITAKLHHDVTARFTVNVKAKGEEAAAAPKEEPKKEDDKGYKAKVKARHSK